MTRIIDLIVNCPLIFCRHIIALAPAALPGHYYAGRISLGQHPKGHGGLCRLNISDAPMADEYLAQMR